MRKAQSAGNTHEPGRVDGAVEGIVPDVGTALRGELAGRWSAACRPNRPGNRSVQGEAFIKKRRGSKGRLGRREKVRIHADLEQGKSGEIARFSGQKNCEKVVKIYSSQGFPLAVSEGAIREAARPVS